MKPLLLTLTTVAVLAMAAPAEAGGRHHGHGNHHYRPYTNHHYNYGHHYRHSGYRRHRNDRYAYIGAGLLLGAVVNQAFQPRVVSSTRVVYRERPAAPYREPAPTNRSVQPLSVERPDVYLRRDPNGECWLIERSEDGTEIITPQDPSVCG